ncbi:MULTISPECIES: DUF262 domain-containing protein [unclassified Roseofilum]|uniref:DUF262 domain-containing protein n=1 Tax=unclassified Roseofilum TaxID=2620099 RepID=UPI000E8DA4EF|nr:MULTISPECIES: DUF262 domain-containing protein [unclassified Roseofilum]MBP0008168.1 DUF262 domain-containing protein [Roseofilum sp. Belize Diploria]MBP0032672.1 DUF262 domain-containing protein [Roseofilum sp. Belize BBD 4]HBQ99189.1 DUF262 domain-containing protein [Cyanobacteria bacterium UBA11691]
MTKSTKILVEPEITNEQKEEAELEIREKKKVVEYDTKEYPVEVLVKKYKEGLEEDTNELYIPDYQREMIWEETRQSKFIESLLLGLPIPYIFVADLRPKQEDNEEDLGRLEIVDGTQRIRTLDRFLNNDLKLCGLEKLKLLNDFKFSDLPLARQRRFNRVTIRMIVLSEKADEETRRDMFERINTGSVQLNEMEKRRGISPGPLVNLLEELGKDSKFIKLCPISAALVKKREPEEFVLRFFAYLENYQSFNRQVNAFLNEYLEKNNDSRINQNAMRTEFHNMLDFVEKYFPNGFSKSKGHVKTPRIRFEAISVGVALALREKPDLKPKSITWLDSPEFKEYTTSDASNSRPKVIRRIEYVRDQLLS